MAKYALRVLTDDGKRRFFPDFARAERWARKHVADSVKERFAKTATIYSEQSLLADVRLDGVGRVWTDIVRLP